MSSSTPDVYVPPSAEADYVGPWRSARQGDGRMNMPTVIALMLSVCIFSLFLYFFLSPICARRRASSAGRPMDVEDAYFMHSRTFNSRTSFNPFTASSAAKTPAAAYGAGTRAGGRITPPPIYTAGPYGQQHYPAVAARRSPSAGSRIASGVGSFTRLFNLARSASAPPVISKPIPQPEEPLPGPDVEVDIVEVPRDDATMSASSLSLSLSLSAPDMTETTILRPCTAPHSVSSTSLHPPASYLPAPSHAVVHAHGSRKGEALRRSLTLQVDRPVSESDARRSIDGTTTYRTSSSLFTILPELNFDSSITSSKIGRAF